jgi:flagellar biosynthesis/type III secretory pathway protein FliH
VDRRGHDPALTARWAEVFLDTQRHDPEALVEILRYIFASERGAQALDDLQRHEPVKDIAMTKYTEMIELARREGLEQGVAKGIEQGVAKGIEQGVAKGIEQGVAKGIEEGLAQGALRALHAQRDALRALITARFGRVDAAVGDAIDAADAPTLTRWLPRVLHAETPEDVVDG